jgi:hypothetical protein
VEEGDFGVGMGGGSGEGFEDTSDYFTKYPTPSDDPDVGVIEPGEIIQGEIYIGELKVAKNGNVFFSVIITNHEEEEKWVVSYFSPTLILNDKVIKDLEAAEAVEAGEEGIVLYGRKGGRPYVFLDTLLSGLFGKPAGESKYHSALFKKLRDGVNNNVLGVEAEMIPSSHPLAKAGTLKFNKVQKSGE